MGNKPGFQRLRGKFRIASGFLRGDAECAAVPRRSNVAAQEQRRRKTVGKQSQRVVDGIEHADPERRRHIGASMTPGETEQSVPVLKCGIRIHQRNAFRTEHVRIGEVVFSYDERFAPKARCHDPAGDDRIETDGRTLRMANRIRPCLFREFRMIEIFVVVHEIQMAAYQCHIAFIAVIEIGQKRFEFQLFFQKTHLHADRPELEVGQKTTVVLFRRFARLCGISRAPYAVTAAVKRVVERQFVFIDEIKTEERRVFSPCDSRIGIDVRHPVADELFPVFHCAGADGDQLFHGIVFRRQFRDVVALAETPVRIKVGCHINAALLQTVEQIVEFVQIPSVQVCGDRGIRIGKQSVVMVEADRVVTAADEFRRKRVRFIPFEIIGGKAEVDPVQTQTFFRGVLKSQRAVFCHTDRSVFSRRSILQKAEIKCASRPGGAGKVEPDPLFALADHIGSALFDRKLNGTVRQRDGGNHPCRTVGSHAE